MPLIRAGRIVADEWTDVGPDQPLPATGAVILPLARWLGERGALLAQDRPLGVRLASHEAADPLLPDLPRLALVALEFPSFRDGRAYSTARLLRERHGFQGELRAVGNVLQDQFLFMDRCGFDAFQVADDAEAAAWAAAIGEFTVFYQPTGDGRLTAPLARRRMGRAE
jgi:uncharacterized protein (DUF934 family)